MAQNINPSTYRGGFLQSAYNTIASFFRKPTGVYGGILSDPELLNTGHTSGPSTVEQLISQGFISNPHINAVVNKKLDEVINIPWFLYDVKDQNKQKQLKAYKRSGNWEAVLDMDKSVYVINEGDSSLAKFLKRPNSKQTFEQFVQSLFAMYELTGEFFCYGIESKVSVREGLLEAIPLPSQLMEVIPTGDWTGNVGSYSLKLDVDRAIKFSKREILHVKNFNPQLSSVYIGNKVFTTLALRGLSNYHSLGRVIASSNDGFMAQMRMIQNGGPIGILSNASNEPMVMPEGESAQNDIDNLQGYTGAHNRGKIKVTTANLKWINLGMNSVDLQLIDMQKATLQNVCNVAKMPLEMMSLEGSTFNNKDAALKEMWNGGILPTMNIIRDSLNDYLSYFYPTIANGTQWIDYDHRAIPALQKDLDKMHKIWVERVQNHLATPSMYQEAMGIDNVIPDENLNKYMRSTNLAFSDEQLPGLTGISNGNNTNTSGN